MEVWAARRCKNVELVESYVAGAQSIDREPEVRLAMARILMARYANRISSMQASLFEDFDPDPKTPLKADAAIAEAARVQLYAGSGRALPYGFDTLCDARNEKTRKSGVEGKRGRV